MDLKPGDKFGDRYQLLSKLDEGGMGEVWKARDTRLATPVSLQHTRSMGSSANDASAGASSVPVRMSFIYESECAEKAVAKAVSD